MSRFSVYSLADVRAVMYHPDTGQYVLSSGGLGRLAVSRSGDLSAHTATADGFVVISRLRSENCTVTLEIPQNSAADAYLRRWARYLDNTADASRFALTTLTVTDAAGEYTLLLEGVTPKRIPDRSYGSSAAALTWTLLAAKATEQ